MWELRKVTNQLPATSYQLVVEGSLGVEGVEELTLGKRFTTAS